MDNVNFVGNKEVCKAFCVNVLFSSDLLGGLYLFE